MRRIGKVYLVHPLIMGGLTGMIISIVAGLMLHYVYHIAEERASKASLNAINAWAGMESSSVELLRFANTL